MKNSASEAVPRKLIGRFLKYTVLWAIVLSVLVYVQNLIIAPQVNWGPGTFTALMTGLLGLLSLFATFAGGVAVQASGGGHTRRVTIAGGLIVALFSFVCLAYLQPLAHYRSMSARGFDMEVRAPFGPDTPGARLAHLRYAREHPTDSQRPSVNTPLLISVSWVEHIFHTPFVVPWLALIYGLVGHIVAELTHPIRPSRRRHVRWILGVLTAFTFLGPATYLGTYTRARPHISGALTAWAMLLGPLLLLLVLWGLAKIMERSRALEKQGADGVVSRG